MVFTMTYDGNADRLDDIPTIASWTRELRKRLHEVSNEITVIDLRVSQMEVKLDERYTSIKEANREMKETIAGIVSKLDDLKTEVTRINIKQVCAIGLVVWAASNYDKLQGVL